jgi:hypothetical protein
LASAAMVASKVSSAMSLSSASFLFVSFSKATLLSTSLRPVHAFPPAPCGDIPLQAAR